MEESNKQLGARIWSSGEEGGEQSHVGIVSKGWENMKKGECREGMLRTGLCGTPAFNRCAEKELVEGQQERKPGKNSVLATGVDEGEVKEKHSLCEVPQRGEERWGLKGHRTRQLAN